MIKIKTLPFKYKKGSMLSELNTETLNHALHESKNHLQKITKDVLCEIHKSESKGTITLSIKNNDLKTEYSDFCCDNFKSTFQE
tara:strand:+ start:337 stop:588 length:252 start_codon:yes stop_codon:yes gene_type:complete